MNQITTEKLLAELANELRAINDDIPELVEPMDELKDELGIDSLDLVEFVARIEHRFRFIVPDEDWQELLTLHDIASYVQEHAPHV